MFVNDIENFIRESFEENYELLKLESGHALSPMVKESALLQVLEYWKKLQYIASEVTNTEIALNLPNQISPNGINYSIDGIVDIVRESEKVIMYDIKTHDSEYVRANLDLYEGQLNIYAYIWKELRSQSLDEMAIIATALPKKLTNAIRSQNENEIQKERELWKPVIEINFNKNRYSEIISFFGKTVDKIENKTFSPPSVERLRQNASERKIPFGTHVCRNCDARFSCTSYKQFYQHTENGKRDIQFTKFIEDLGDENDQGEWAIVNLASTLDLSEK